MPCMLHYPQDGDTPLCQASSNGHTAVVRLLLENKADPNISNKVNRSVKTISLVANDYKLVVMYEIYDV